LKLQNKIVAIPPRLIFTVSIGVILLLSGHYSRIYKSVSNENIMISIGTIVKTSISENVKQGNYIKLPVEIIRIKAISLSENFNKQIRKSFLDTDSLCYYNELFSSFSQTLVKNSYLNSGKPDYPATDKSLKQEDISTNRII
jgi:hypothetical protein